MYLFVLTKYLCICLKTMVNMEVGGGCDGGLWCSAVGWSVIEMLARINLPKPKINMSKLEMTLSITKGYKFWISFCNSHIKIHCALMLWNKTHICLWIKLHFVCVFLSWLNINWFYFILIALLIRPRQFSKQMRAYGTWTVSQTMHSTDYPLQEHHSRRSLWCQARRKLSTRGEAIVQRSLIYSYPYLMRSDWMYTD